jgi:hypothetical protein
MTTKQLNKITISLASEDICDANAILLPSVPAFADAYADVQSHVTNIQTFSQNQSQDITGIARDKQQARQAMCNLALPVAGAIHAYATKTDNNELEAKSNFSLSDLMAGRDSASAECCLNLHDLANTILADLASYGITASKLTLMKAGIGAYNLLISKPRDTRVKGKTITGSIETEFAALDKAFSIMDDLIPQFAPANQQFVDDYNNARTIVNTAASHASPTPPTPPPATPKP